MFSWCNSIGLIGLVSWLLCSNVATLSLEKEQKTSMDAGTSLANLPDGAYQLCTEPDPLVSSSNIDRINFFIVIIV